MEYIINIILLIAIVVMALIARENYKTGKRTFRKDGKLKVDKIIFYIVLYWITLYSFLPLMAMILLYLFDFIFRIPEGTDVLGLVLKVLGLSIIILIRPIHKLVKYIVLAFPK